MDDRQKQAAAAGLKFNVRSYNYLHDTIAAFKVDAIRGILSASDTEEMLHAGYALQATHKLLDRLIENIEADAQANSEQKDQ